MVVLFDRFSRRLAERERRAHGVFVVGSELAREVSQVGRVVSQSDLEEEPSVSEWRMCDILRQ